MQKPVAVTGATGFVGGHLLASLRATGRPVRVLVRDPAKFDNIDTNTEVVTGDLDDRAALARLVAGCGAVIHCAGAIAALDRQGFLAVNQTGAANVAKAAVEAGVKRFVLVSSLAAREAHLSDYAASKKAGEEMVKDIVAAENLAIVRPPAVYGPGDRATLPLIKALTGWRAILPGRKDQRISLIFVKDLAAALVRLADSEQAGGPFEIDDGRARGYSFKDITQLAGEAQGRKIGLTLLPRTLVALAGFGAGMVSKLTGKVFILSPAKV
ncbi:MAG TPA: NAD-dependent epimerase/dehydratase family protein, partial [Rhizobiales bacterium]|nr:NAD-dependent epimerase/dehydratase family protein [Hyphomicrobiales bacterium]